MRLALAFLLALGAWAQTPFKVDLYVLESGLHCGALPAAVSSEVATGAAINMGNVRAGDCVEMRLRLRSRETGPFTVSLMTASGFGFSVENEPSLPYTMSPGSNIDFRLRFSPKDPGTYPGTLYVIDKQIALTAVSPDGITVQAQNGTSFDTITTESTVDFGSVMRLQSVARQFALVNRTATAQTVSSMIIIGPGYSVEGVTLPMTVAPGATKTFAVRFAPLIAGILRGTLTIDGRDFKLAGFALELPAPTISFAPAPAVTSGQQVTLKIQMSEPSRVAASVAVQLSGLEADSVVALLPAGGRTTTLALKENDTVLSVVIQTGTTAGTLKLAADLGTQHIETQLTMAPAAPALAAVTAARVSGRLALLITGFDNTRSMTQAGFQFYDLAGTPIGGVIRADVAAAFSKYFTGSNLGGVFALSASFPVTGDINSIGAVDAEMTSSNGTTRFKRIAF